MEFLRVCFSVFIYFSQKCSSLPSLPPFSNLYILFQNITAESNQKFSYCGKQYWKKTVNVYLCILIYKKGNILFIKFFPREKYQLRMSYAQGMEEDYHSQFFWKLSTRRSHFLLLYFSRKSDLNSFSQFHITNKTTTFIFDLIFLPTLTTLNSCFALTPRHCYFQK